MSHFLPVDWEKNRCAPKLGLTLKVELTHQALGQILMEVWLLLILELLTAALRTVGPQGWNPVVNEKDSGFRLWLQISTLLLSSYGTLGHSFNPSVPWFPISKMEAIKAPSSQSWLLPCISTLLGRCSVLSDPCLIIRALEWMAEQPRVLDVLTELMSIVALLRGMRIEDVFICRTISLWAVIQ